MKTAPTRRKPARLNVFNVKRAINATVESDIVVLQVAIRIRLFNQFANSAKREHTTIWKGRNYVKTVRLVSFVQA